MESYINIRYTDSGVDKTTPLQAITVLPARCGHNHAFAHIKFCALHTISCYTNHISIYAIGNHISIYAARIQVWTQPRLYKHLQFLYYVNYNLCKPKVWTQPRLYPNLS